MEKSNEYSNIEKINKFKKEKEFTHFGTAWMELESVMLSEISQAVRVKYHMISPLTKGC